VKGVSEAIFDSATSQLSLTVYESIGLWWLMSPFITCEKRFGAIFYSAASHFSLTVYESKRAVSTDESICHM